jgi:predicted enzyme related to lactoylglutathione lyase
MSKVVHFEVTAQDPHRSVAFYKAVFGWKFTKWLGDAAEEYWMIDVGDGDAITGGLMKPEEGLKGFINTMGVDDIDAAMARVVDAGGSIVMPKHEVAGDGWHAYVADPEGGVFGLMQSTRNAA